MDHASLIYQLLALSTIIAQANLMLERLGMPECRIRSTEQIKETMVSPPLFRVSHHLGLEGLVRTADIHFAIRTEGPDLGFGPQFLTFVRLGPNNAEDWADGDGTLGAPKGLITKDEAYRQGRQWLERAGVDVALLEKDTARKIFRHDRPSFPKGFVSPEYSISWAPRHRTDKAPYFFAEVHLNALNHRLVSISLYYYRYWKFRVVSIPHDIGIAFLPDGPVRDFLGKEEPNVRARSHSPLDNNYTNALALLAQPPERERAQRTALLQETARVLKVLGCTQLPEPTERSVSDVYGDPPAFGVGGRVEFTNGAVQFDSAGRLQEFWFTPRGYHDQDEWMGETKCNATESEARRAVMEELPALGFDMERLDREYDAFHERGRLRGSHGHSEPSALFYFYWTSKRRDAPARLRVEFYGDSKQIGEIHLDDPALWKGPRVKF